MTEKDKETLSNAAGFLRLLSRRHYDEYKRHADGTSKVVLEKARTAYEKYSELVRMARELDFLRESDL